MLDAAAGASELGAAAGACAKAGAAMALANRAAVRIERVRFISLWSPSSAGLPVIGQSTGKAYSDWHATRATGSKPSLLGRSLGDGAIALIESVH